MPEDPAIPAPEVKAKPQFTRTFVDETKILQRELKDDVPGWIWAAANVAVLALYSLVLIALVASAAWRGAIRAAAGPTGRRRPGPSRR